MCSRAPRSGLFSSSCELAANPLCPPQEKVKGDASAEMLWGMTAEVRLVARPQFIFNKGEGGRKGKQRTHVSSQNVPVVRKCLIELSRCGN